MRVLCIDNLHPLQPDGLRPADKIREGEVYHVIEQVTIGEQLFFLLAEKLKATRAVLYKATRFLPCMGEGEVATLPPELLPILEKSPQF
jgi:hypothetical protein